MTFLFYTTLDHSSRQEKQNAWRQLLVKDFFSWCPRHIAHGVSGEALSDFGEDGQEAEGFFDSVTFSEYFAFFFGIPRLALEFEDITELEMYDSRQPIEKNLMRYTQGSKLGYCTSQISYVKTHQLNA